MSIKEFLLLIIDLPLNSWNFFGLFFQATPTKKAGIPDKIIITPIPTSNGFSKHGTITKKAQIITKTIGTQRDTYEIKNTILLQ